MYDYKVRTWQGFYARIKKNAKIFASTVGILAFSILVVNILHTGCIIKYLTGISCMGCGMTRALRSVISGEFGQAFYYNPCIYLLPITPIWIVLDRKQQNAMEWILCSIVLTVYLIRVIMGHPIVQWDLSDGVLYKQVISNLLKEVSCL